MKEIARRGDKVYRMGVRVQDVEAGDLIRTVYGGYSEILGIKGNKEDIFSISIRTEERNWNCCGIQSYGRRIS